METKMVRIGKVSSVNIEKARVQVVFEDIDNMVSVDLPLLFPQGLKNKFYAVPDIGENVVCLFIEQGLSDGYCLGSFYTDLVLPPISSQDKVHFTFEDGTFIEYDRKEHKLVADIKGDAELKVKNVSVEADHVQSISQSINATTKEATIQATNVNLTCTNLNIQSKEDIIIQSKTKVILKGKVETQVVN